MGCTRVGLISQPSFITTMKRSITTTNLTKAYIESKVSQEAIVSKYLNIPIETVQDCIEHNHLIESVFRDDDTNKSMGIQYNNKGKLKVRDFGGWGFFDDVYGVVAYVLSVAYKRPIDTNNKQDFYFVLKHIAHTFRDVIDGKEIDPLVDSAIKASAIALKSRRPIIEIAPRSWNKYDKDIWGRWGISLDYLNTHFVIPVDQYYINRTVDSNPKYRYTAKDPCYAYMLGQNIQGIYLFKLYFPRRNRSRETKFITNCNVLEGLLNLELDNYDFIIITKSTKDRLAIGSAISNNSFYGGAFPYNVGIINLPSENYKLREDQYAYLSKKLAPNGQIISFLDFDETGRAGAKYMKDTYDIPYIFITRGEFGLPDYGCKDFSELFDKYTITEIIRFIKETITYVKLRFSKDLQDSMSDESGRIYDFDLPY